VASGRAGCSAPLEHLQGLSLQMLQSEQKTYLGEAPVAGEVPVAGDRLV
jgi:hypothetical protein